MTRAKHARTTTTGRKLAAGALSVPMALTMAGTASATEPAPFERAAASSSADAALTGDALAAKPAELPVQAVKKVKTTVAEPVQPVVPASDSSRAVMTLSVVCDGEGTKVSVTSDKDISNVKVYYADGSMEEIPLTGLGYTGLFEGDVVRVTAKSGTTTVVDDSITCVTSDGQGAPAPAAPAVPVPTSLIGGGNGGAGSNSGSTNSEADLDLAVTCVEGGVRVVVTSDKDISNVKVHYSDGSMEEVPLDGSEFDEVFLGDVVKVTTKSGNTEVEVLAEDFAPCRVTPGTGGVVDGGVVDGGVADEDAADEDAADDEADDIGGGGGGAGSGTPPVVTPPANGGATPVVTTPVSSAPVVSTPVVPVQPISGLPAPTAGSGIINAGTAAPQAVAPRFGAAASTASPSALPFTGSTTSLLLALGTGLVIVGGGLAISGRRETVTATA